MASDAMRLGLGLAAAVLLLVPLLPAATAADPVFGVPPDGPAGPVKSLREIGKGLLGQEVTTKAVKVKSVSCTACDSPTTPADFTVSDGDATVRVHVQNSWQPGWNPKKQNFLPRPGMMVVVQGRVQAAGSTHIIEMKRFGEVGHPGPTVHAYDVAAGKSPRESYAWLAPVTVLNVARWDDGDYTFDVRDPAGGGLIHVEFTPPFYGQLHIPKKGETVTPYGMLHFDDDHGWWEMHPVRCWSQSECVPAAASYLRNGMTPGTPASGGYYLQGGVVPLWVPMSGMTLHQADLHAHFTPSPNGNEWWVQVTVTTDRSTLAWVDARVGVSGTWIRLGHAWWGDWVKSMHAPAGSQVQFRAVAADGGFQTSAWTEWPPH
ncbi:MAG: hypothetical protein V4510_03230 [bacterium]